MCHIQFSHRGIHQSIWNCCQLNLPVVNLVDANAQWATSSYSTSVAGSCVIQLHVVHAELSTVEVYFNFTWHGSPHTSTSVGVGEWVPICIGTPRRNEPQVASRVSGGRRALFELTLLRKREVEYSSSDDGGQDWPEKVTQSWSVARAFGKCPCQG